MLLMVAPSLQFFIDKILTASDVIDRERQNVKRTLTARSGKVSGKDRVAQLFKSHGYLRVFCRRCVDINRIYTRSSSNKQLITSWPAKCKIRDNLWHSYFT